MSKSAAFVLPAGIDLDVSNGSFSMTHDGDIILEQTLGLPMGVVRSAGSVTFNNDTMEGEIHADQEVKVTGDVKGTIRSGGNTTVTGIVSGSLHSETNIHVNGQVQNGQLHASQNIVVEGSSTHGQLTAEGKVSISGNVDGSVITGGEIEINGEHIAAKSLNCTGTIDLKGDLTGDTIHGEVVVLTGKAIKVKAISATQKVVIGDCKLTVDVIMAPEIEISPGASGRVTVIESSSEVASGAIKGGFSLAEYEELFGDASAFLAERNVAPLGETPPASAPENDEVQEDDLTSPDAEPENNEVEEDDLTIPDAEPEPEPAEVVHQISNDIEIEDDEEIEIVAAAVVAPTPDPSPEDNVDLSDKDDENDEFHNRLTEATQRIVSCYEGTEMPAAVSDLQRLVSNKEYDAIRSNITEVWNGLLGFHQSKGIRPHHQVTHAFNVIHGLMQNNSF